MQCLRDARDECQKEDRTECDGPAQYIVNFFVPEYGIDVDVELCNHHTAEQRAKWPEEIQAIRSMPR